MQEKATFTIFHTGRYPCEWPEEPDAEAPPGLEFARDLYAALLAHPGVTWPHPGLDEDDWEHSNWFLFVRWKEHQYMVTLEPGAVDHDPPRWMLGVFRQARNPWQWLFGGRGFAWTVDGAFLDLLSEETTALAGTESLQWITQDEAIALIYA